MKMEGSESLELVFGENVPCVGELVPDSDMFTEDDSTCGKRLDPNCGTFTQANASSTGEHDTGTFTEIDELYNLLTDDFVPQNVQLYLECNDESTVDGQASSTISFPQSRSGNNPKEVNIGGGDNVVYRLTFPEDDGAECSKSDRFHCDECEKTFSRRTLLMDHRSAAHHARDLFGCKVCAYKGQKYRDWYKHMKRKHPQHSVSIEQLFQDHSELGGSNSTNEQSDTIKNSSDTCKRESDRKKIEVIQSDFKCPKCEKTFSNKRSMIYHKRVHTQGRIHFCTNTECGKAFKNSSALNEHKLTVHGAKVYKCQHDHCTKAYGLKRDLVYHQKLHTDQYQCSFAACEKSFRDAYNLRIHMRHHTGEKPIKCLECDFTCAQKNSLDFHMRTKHKV